MKKLALFAAFLLFASPALAQQQQVASNAVSPSQTSNAYRLGAGDKMHITVFGEETLTGDYEVTASGAVAFPLIGEVPALGLTPEELSRSIGTRLQRGFLRNPRVTTAMITYRPFFILGEVNNPGSYPYAAGLNVTSAVATAGGYTYRANRRRVFIRRAGETQEHQFDLNSGVAIQPGDTIRIGERFF
ncbi:polysaccharide biosynthesis/export family protein [Terricaulis sp.]|uniref:polysaccharide biosynthesis/export family protein n=1 Tax=Terricaulis sp. TaxID=2768686 RepID=UPI0037848EE3